MNFDVSWLTGNDVRFIFLLVIHIFNQFKNKSSVKMLFLINSKTNDMRRKCTQMMRGGNAPNEQIKQKTFEGYF